MRQLARLLLLLFLALLPGGSYPQPATTQAQVYLTLPPSQPEQMTPGYSMGDKSVGSWITNPSDDIGALYAISAISSNDVWAVGATSSYPAKIVLIRWDGKRWDVVARLRIGNSHYEYSAAPAALVALAPDDVWVVGKYAIDENVTYSLVAHWNGTTFEVVPHPTSPGQRQELRAVTALGPNNIWAAGSDILHFDGKTWSTVSAQDQEGKTLQLVNERDNVLNRYSILNSIAAISANDIWAVGEIEHDTLTVHWNGTNWKQVPSPDLMSASGQSNIEWPQNILLSVAAVASSDVWAVGYYTNGWMGNALPRIEPIVIHWDGKSWTKSSLLDNLEVPLIHSYYDPPFPARFVQIITVSKNDVWIIGDSVSPMAPTLVHWDGQVWRSNPCPSKDIGAYTPRLFYGIAEVEKDEVWIAGAIEINDTRSTKTFGYVLDPDDGPCPTATPFPTVIPFQTEPTMPATPPSLPTSYGPIPTSAVPDAVITKPVPAVPTPR